MLTTQTVAHVRHCGFYTNKNAEGENQNNNDNVAVCVFLHKMK